MFIFKKQFKLSRIAICTSLVLFSVVNTYAETNGKVETILAPKKDDMEPKKNDAAEAVIFNKRFLPLGSSNVDVKKFELGTPIPSGMYTADISVNGQVLDKTQIEIKSDNGNNPQVCMTERLLSNMNVNMDKIQFSEAAGCIPLSQLIEQASAEFDISQQLLTVSIPQSYIQRIHRGTVSSNLWEQGVNAAFMGYSANYSNNSFELGESQFFSSSLDFGVNLSSWRIRHSGYYSWNNDMGSDYQSTSTYAQHDVTALKGQFSLGEVSTSGVLFDSVAMTGAQLMTDERMLPDSQRGYAPIIRGVAKSVARVVVSQNGFVIHEISVRPGEFVIDDLYPTGYGGDLEVTVYESDGSQQRFSVPYSAVAQLLRPGTYRYEVSLGETRNTVNVPGGDELKFVQGTLQYGLSNNLTAYAGTQLAENYYSGMVGVALGSPFGSFAFDATHSATKLMLSHGERYGQSLRASYSKNILETGSSFSLATYKFSTEDYMDLATAANAIAYEGEWRSMRPKSRFSASVNQSLGEWGQLSFSGYVENYWENDQEGTQYQLGYSTNIKSVSIGLTATRAEISQFDGEMRTDNSVQLTMNVPLDFGGQRTQVSGAIGRDAQGEINQRVGLGGALGEDQRINYGLSAGRSGATGDIDANAYGQYLGNKATVGASVSKGPGYRGMSANASGMVVAFEDGIVMSPHKGETMAIVKAKGAQGAKIAGYHGIELDGDGMAVVSNLQPYQMNEIGVDPEGLSDDVELKVASQRFAPRAGSISVLEYQTVEGESFYASVVDSNGNVAEFGADVYDQQGKLVGVIGQGGQLYARMESPSEWLKLQTGSGTCQLKLPKQNQPIGALETLVCR